MKKDVQGFDISGTSAAIIGVGGLGCNVAVHLSGSGIGQLFLCDSDSVSETNLNRQFFYTGKDIGQPKADAAFNFLKTYAPDVKIETRNVKIESPEDLEWAKGADIIISAVDNQRARQVINDFCTANKIPGLCGVINGFYGMTYLYVPGKSPCFRCAGLTDPDIPGVSVSSAAGVIGAQMSSIAIKYLLSKSTIKNPCGAGADASFENISTTDFGFESTCGKLYIYDDEEIHSLKIFSDGCICTEEEL